MNDPEVQQLKQENNKSRPVVNNKNTKIRILVIIILLLNWSKYLVFEIPKKEKELKSLDYEENKINLILYMLAIFKLVNSFLQVYLIYFLVRNILILLLSNPEIVICVQNFLEKLKLNNIK